MLIHPTISLCVFVISCELILQCYSYDYQIDRIGSDKPPINENRKCVAPERCEPGWIDPFDMGGGDRYSANLYETLQSQDSITEAPRPGWKDPYRGEGDSSQRTSSQKYIIYQRFINVLLRAMGLKDSPESLLSKVVRLELTVTGQDLQLLQRFGRDGEQSISVEKVSDILNNIFSQSQRKTSSFTTSLNKALTWLSSCVTKLLSSLELIVITSSSLMLITVLWLVFITQSYRLAIFTALCMIFFAGFGFNWIRIYEEREIEKYYDHIIHGDAPRHCTGELLGWCELIYYKLFGEDCLQFYKRRDVPAMVKVSPTEVLAVTLSTMIIEPVQNIGNAFGCFVYGVVGNLPWYLKPIAVPLAFILPPVFIFLLLVLFFNYQLSFSGTGIHILPSFSHPMVHKQKDKYIEDLPNKSNDMSAKGGFENILSGCKEPLFLWMNMSAVKRISSNIDNADIINGSENDVASNTLETRTEEVAYKDNINSEASKEKGVTDTSENSKSQTKSIYTTTERHTNELPCEEESSSVTMCSYVKDSTDPLIRRFQGAGDHNLSPSSSIKNVVKQK